MDEELLEKILNNKILNDVPIINVIKVLIAIADLNNERISKGIEQE